MDNKTLSVLNGTDYTVKVQLDYDGDYEVQLYKPANPKDTYNKDTEIVGSRYLNILSDESDLVRVVEELITSDRQTLAGTYTGESNDY